MAISIENEIRFLGRKLDTKTMTWIFSDSSSSPLPEEMRIDVLSAIDSPAPNGLLFFGTLFSWKQRLGL